MLTLQQRIRRGELAQELIQIGVFPGITQELTGNYIDTLTKLEPKDNMGREHITVRLTVLADVMKETLELLSTMTADGQLALQELQDGNRE